MKKLFTFAGMMAAAAIALTGCQTKEAAPEFSDSFTMEFAMDDTRTANDGMSTLWEENDALCLFEAAAGTSSYTAHKATIAEGAGTKAAKFTVDGTAPTGKTDWYALYPYSDKITTPGAREDGFSYIGHSQGEKQKGYDNMSHLSRSLCPLYGVAKGADGINAGIKMHNLASVIEFEVTNNTSSAFVINSLKLDATEDIVGSYFIDITGNAPVYTPTDAEHAFSSATVQVTKDGDNEVPELAKGKSAKLYMAIKPYTHKSGSTFNITVNVTQGGLDKSAEIKLNPTGNQCKFEAGKIKKVAVNVKSLESATSIQDALEGGKHTVEGATVVMTCFKSFFIKDNTGTMWVYMNQSDLGVAKGDKINITGNVTVSNNAHRFNNTEANPVEITKKGTGTPGNPATWNGSKVKDAYGTADNTAYVKIDAASQGSGNYTVSGAGDVIVYVTERAPGIDNAPYGENVTLTGYVCGYKEYNGTPEVMFYAESIEIKQATGDETEYVKVDAVTSGKTYLIVANNVNGKTYAATAIPSNKTYGRLDGAEVTISGNSIKRVANANQEFIITATESGYTIAQSDTRLLGADSEHNGTFQIGDSYDHTFTFTPREDGTWTIYYPSLQKTFYHGGGTYTNFSLVTAVPEDAVYPMLFEKVE